MSIDLSALEQAVQTFAEEVAAGGARRALDTVRSGVPSGKTGELRGSEHDDTAGTSISFGYSAEHASFTDQGTAAHPIPTPVAFFWENQGIDIIIVPQGRRARFETPDGTVVVMGKPNVDHPGTTGTGWWTDIIGEEGSLEGLIEFVQEVADTITVVV